MTHQPVWSSIMIELPLVVTARLHVTRLRRDEGMPRHPNNGLPPPRVDTRTEARLTVTLGDAPAVRADGNGNQAPPDRRRPEPLSESLGTTTAGVKAKPSGRPAAGLDPGSARQPTG
jgi:hypothetical protein